MRILWVDDQLDVIKSFSSLLSSLSPEVISAQDGIEALSRLKSQHFDILLLDLKIPPDTWGGLWLLEEIRAAKIRIPVVVLSGEGTQSETIAALRLGARDYVTKDNVQMELLQRVRVILEESNSEIENGIADSFPTPLALPYKRYLNTISPVSRLKRLIEFFESGLRLCCIIGFCELRSIPRLADSPKLTCAVLQGPSMGTWNQVRQVLAKHLPKHGMFYQLHSAFDNDTAISVVQLRNDIAHGSEPSEPLAADHLIKLEVSLRTVVGRLWQHPQFEIVVPTGLRFDGKSFHVDGRVIAGDGNTLPNLHTTVDVPVICDQPYLLDGNGSAVQWVNLFPFLCVEPAAGPSAWRILVFDGLKMDRHKMPSGDEPIRFIDIWSGKRNEIPASRPNSRMLPSFLLDCIPSS